MTNSAAVDHNASLIKAIQYNADGLVPAIAQDYHQGHVLMMAWMNQTALVETLKTGRVCYWSRSRQQLWRKGETSGHYQHLVACQLDCDGDSLLLQVEQTGVACHTGTLTCFFRHFTPAISWRSGEKLESGDHNR